MKKILKRQEYLFDKSKMLPDMLYSGMNVDYVEVDGELLKKLESNRDPKTGNYKECLQLTYWEDETKTTQIIDYYDEFGNKLI